MADDITAGIVALAGLDRPALKVRYQDVLGSDAPTRMSPEIMTQAIAYRLQENAFGGLSPRARAALLDRRNGERTARPKATRRIKPGTRFIREWQGRTITVVADESGGFVFDGKTWRSLSAIARTVTGTRWSGPAFFGLDRGAGR